MTYRQKIDSLIREAIRSGEFGPALDSVFGWVLVVGEQTFSTEDEYADAYTLIEAAGQNRAVTAGLLEAGAMESGTNLAYSEEE